MDYLWPVMFLALIGTGAIRLVSFAKQLAREVDDQLHAELDDRAGAIDKKLSDLDQKMAKISGAPATAAAPVPLQGTIETLTTSVLVLQHELQDLRRQITAIGNRTTPRELASAGETPRSTDAFAQLSPPTDDLIDDEALARRCNDWFRQSEELSEGGPGWQQLNTWIHQHDGTAIDLGNGGPFVLVSWGSRGEPREMRLIPKLGKRLRYYKLEFFSGLDIDENATVTRVLTPATIRFRDPRDAETIVPRVRQGDVSAVEAFETVRKGLLQ